jgi:dCTP deaminase
MAILSDGALHRILPLLIKEPDHSMVNPASIDIRIGRHLICETMHGLDNWTLLEEGKPFAVHPGAFLLVETYEHIMVPNGYCVELKLKSTAARKGWNHSLAFWVDPGWDGILTMELKNQLEYGWLTLERGQRFAQIIVHQLDSYALKPYHGRYQGAGGVELAKPPLPTPSRAE